VLTEEMIVAISRLRREIADHGETSRTLKKSEERLRLANEGAGIGPFDGNLQTAKVIWCATIGSRAQGTRLWQPDIG
jgi:hypothetical protein